MIKNWQFFKNDRVLIIHYPLEPPPLPLHDFFVITFKLFEVTLFKKKKSLQPCIVIHCHLLPLLSFTIKLLQPVPLSIIQSGHMPHGSTYLHPLSLPFTSDHQIQRAFFSTSQHLCIFCYTVPLLTLKCHLFFFCPHLYFIINTSF